MPAPGEDTAAPHDSTASAWSVATSTDSSPATLWGSMLRMDARTRSPDRSRPAPRNRLVKGYADTPIPTTVLLITACRHTPTTSSPWLNDAYEFAHDPMAMQVHEKLTRSMVAYLPEKALSRAETSPGRTRIPLTPGMSCTRCRKISSLLTSALAMSSIATWPSRPGRRLLLRTVFPGQQRASLRACLQPRQRIQFSHASLSHAGQRNAVARRRNGFDMLKRLKASPLADGAPMVPSANPERGQLGDSLSTTHASFETPCAPTDTSRSRAICFASPRIPATGTISNRCSTTPFWGLRIRRTALRSTTRITTIPARKSVTAIRGPVVGDFP